MSNIRRLTKIGLPTLLGISLAWVGNRIIRNEKKLKKRELELKMQLKTKSIKPFN